MSDLNGILDIDPDIAGKLRDAGYDDFTTIAAASSIEIARTADIDQEQASELQERAYENAEFEGFQTASEVEEPANLLEFDVPEKVEGWTLINQSSNRLAWATPSGYKVTIGGLGLEVSGPLPPVGEMNEDYDPRQTTVQERTLKPEFDDPTEAIGYAVGWMESHPLEFEEDLTEFTGISERTAEYLLFKHEVHSHQHLYELHQNSTLSDIVGPQYLEDLEAEMTRIFGGEI